MSLVHSSKAISSLGGYTLADYRDQIYREVDGVALRVGKLLREARLEHPERFDRWVIHDLPFGLETARRMMAISAAYEKLSPDTLRGLPRPWQALYALKELPAATLQRAVDAGDISPDMTVEAAKAYARAVRPATQRNYTRANWQAAKLMQARPSDLSSDMRQRLIDWVLSND